MLQTNSCTLSRSQNYIYVWDALEFSSIFSSTRPRLVHIAHEIDIRSILLYKIHKWNPAADYFCYCLTFWSLMYYDLKSFPAVKTAVECVCSARYQPFLPGSREQLQAWLTALLNIFTYLHFSHLADVITAAEWTSHSQIRAFNSSSVGVALSASWQ